MTRVCPRVASRPLRCSLGPWGHERLPIDSARPPPASSRWGCRTLARGCTPEREDGYVSGIPTVHGFVTNLALGVTALLERQVSRHHLIFGTAIGTFEDDDHCFTMCMRSTM